MRSGARSALQRSALPTRRSPRAARSRTGGTPHGSARALWAGCRTCGRPARAPGLAPARARVSLRAGGRVNMGRRLHPSPGAFPTPTCGFALGQDGRRLTPGRPPGRRSAEATGQPASASGHDAWGRARGCRGPLRPAAERNPCPAGEGAGVGADGGPPRAGSPCGLQFVTLSGHTTRRPGAGSRRRRARSPAAGP